MTNKRTFSDQVRGRLFARVRVRIPFGGLGGHYGGRGSSGSRGGGAAVAAAPSHHGLTMTLVELLDRTDIVTRVWPASSLVTGLRTSKATNGSLRKNKMWKDVRLVVKAGCGDDEVRLALVSSA